MFHLLCRKTHTERYFQFMLQVSHVFFSPLCFTNSPWKAVHVERGNSTDVCLRKNTCFSLSAVVCLRKDKWSSLMFNMCVLQGKYCLALICPSIPIFSICMNQSSLPFKLTHWHCFSIISQERQCHWMLLCFISGVSLSRRKYGLQEEKKRGQFVWAPEQHPGILHNPQLSYTEQHLARYTRLHLWLNCITGFVHSIHCTAFYPLNIDSAWLWSHTIIGAECNTLT